MVNLKGVILSWAKEGWRRMGITGGKLLLLILAVVLGVIGQFFFKSGATQLAAPRLNSLPAGLLGFLLAIMANPSILAGLFSYGLSTIVWLYILKSVELSRAYPFLALNYILILLGGAVLFHERISPGKVGGSLLIVLGVLLIARN